MVGTNEEEFNPFSQTDPAGEYFVGRGEQLDLFRNHLKGLIAGHPQNIYVAGLHGTGKTSFLLRLVELASAEGLPAAYLPIDPGSAKDQLSSVTRRAVEAVDAALALTPGMQSSSLTEDWDKGEKSRLFRQPRDTRLASDRVAADFKLLQKTLRDIKIAGVLLCLDEAQRLDPWALSGIKNALQQCNSFLVVISLRLVTAPDGPGEAGRQVLLEKATLAEEDIGASRFFMTPMEMGPFRDDAEGIRCIEKRLKKNRLKFSYDTTRSIVQMQGRLPGAIIDLASEVYKTCTEMKKQIAEEAVLHAAFRALYPRQLSEAARLVDGITDGTRAVLREFVRRPAATPSELRLAIYPNASADMQAYLDEKIASDMLLISRLWPTVEETANGYSVSDPVGAYALRVLLKESAADDG